MKSKGVSGRETRNGRAMKEARLGLYPSREGTMPRPFLAQEFWKKTQ